jgi:hypothetical protein
VHLADLLDDFRGKGTVALLGLIFGALATWLAGRWKRYQEQRSILRGDARDTVVIQHHLITSKETAPKDGSPARTLAATLRIRSLGQSELYRVVPNGHLAAVLLKRAFQVTQRHTLISMDGAEGSYLLETLTNFVSDRVANAPFEHDRYVMAPCCEPAGLAEHQPITILLIPVTDLTLFDSWGNCRDVQVEHGADGARILTLMELARRFREEQEKIAALRKAGQRTRYIETMYLLDLAIDRRTAPLPLRDVPWGRYEGVLKEMNLE